MFEHICRTCLIHLQRTCQPEEMLCFTCSSDEVPGELLLFSPDSAWCKHARSSQRPPSIIAFQRPRPPFVVGLFRPLLSAKLCLLFLPPLPQSVGLAIFCRSSRWRSFLSSRKFWRCQPRRNQSFMVAAEWRSVGDASLLS